MAISLGRGLWPLHQPASNDSVGKAKDKARTNEGVDNKDAQDKSNASAPSSPSGHTTTDDYAPGKANTIFYANWPAPPSGQQKR